MARHSKRGKKKGKGLIILIVLVLIVAGGFFGFKAWVAGIAKPYNPAATETVALTVPEGASTTKICNLLEENGIIGSASAYKLWFKLNDFDGKLQAGDYILSASMSGEEIAELMQNGHSTVHNFTIPEGYSVLQTAYVLSEKYLVDYSTFLDEVQNGSFDYDFINDIDYNGQGYRFEGFLFPETYNIYDNASPHDYIDRMLKQFDVVWNSNPDYKTRASELGLSLRDVITIASIIEREAKIDSDRPLVSSVIYNRLDINMKLQMCSTVQYILGEPKETLTYKDIAIDDPYNTYLYAGLPPGPICSPGKASIEAALYPADTDYIYFVVSEKLDGSHNFSSNSADFERDKARYQAALKQRGN